MRFFASPKLLLVSSLAITLVSGSLVATAQSDVTSPMRDRGNCQAVDATAEPRIVVDCPADQGFDFCFTRELVDRAGVLSGRMEVFSDPTKGAEISHNSNQFIYGAFAKIETDEDVLEMDETGIFDAQSKEWSGLATLTRGAGSFEGATGTLATFGDSEAMGRFIGTVCSG
jgi:hypothetical protein